MAIYFHFPYFTDKPNVPDEQVEGLRKGFVSGVYQVDQKLFSKIEKGKKF